MESNWVGPYIFTTLEATTTCADPSDQMASNMTETSAELSWTENGTATAWDLEIVDGGTTPSGTPTVSATGDNPYTASGLTENTSYDFYVRANCGGTESNWVGPYSFTTLEATTTCADPSDQSASNITETSADLSWTENGTATAWDLEILDAGTTPTGTATVSATGDNPYTATGLTENTSYDFYVRANCGGTESNWVGPYNFTTLEATIACAAPSDQSASNITETTADLSWTENGIATEWDLEIVDAGTTPTGTPNVNTTMDNPYTATGLTAGTSYDFYVRANCGVDASDWAGPFNFVTEQSSAGIEENDNKVSLVVFPNPNKGSFAIQIESAQTQNVSVEVLNVAGQTMFGKSLEVDSSNTVQVDLGQVENGIYFVKVSTTTGSKVQKVTIQ